MVIEMFLARLCRFFFTFEMCIVRSVFLNGLDKEQFVGCLPEKGLFNLFSDITFFGCTDADLKDAIM